METLPEWLTSDTACEIGIVHVFPLTIYERTAVLGRRALQLSQGAPLRAVSDSLNPLDNAQAELDAGVIPPMRVIRYLPDGRHVQHELSSILRSFKRVRVW
jgi:DNA-directed RNA polymerase subunit K/omega